MLSIDGISFRDLKQNRAISVNLCKLAYITTYVRVSTLLQLDIMPGVISRNTNNMSQFMVWPKLRND